MAEHPIPQPAEDRPVQARLHELAEFLRHADNLRPEARQKLADLVDELREDVKPEDLTPEERTHLAGAIAQLTRDLRAHRHPAPSRAPSLGVERAIARAEADHPVITGFLERLLDTLSSIGI
jgi:uncharacterized protein YciW